MALVCEGVLSLSRTAAQEAYAAVCDEEGQRALALGDLYYLLTQLLGRRDMEDDWLYARCREVAAAPDGYLDVWAREHYKSTIITVGLTIQAVLADPELTVGIFSHTRPIAKSFLKQIKREFEGNARLRELFPHISPPGKGERRTWSEDEGLIVRRERNPKEATIEAWGLVDGQPTGKHFDLLIYDDVVTLESVSTPEQIKKTTDAWRLSLNLGARGGRRQMIGTRYHACDTYAELLRQGSVLARLHPATQDGLPDGEPVFLPAAELARKRRDMGPYIFACQMLQNPLADHAQGFAESWFQRLPGAAPAGFADPVAAGMNRYLVVDPANSKKEGSDFTAIWVVGLGRDGGYYILDGAHDRLNLAERTRTLFHLHQKWRPLATGYEQYGMQADIDHIRLEMERLNYRFPVITLAGTLPKADRIRRLVPVFEQGRLHFPAHLPSRRADGTWADLTREFYEQEYLTFPVCRHDDMLDALARLLDPALGATFPAPDAEPAGPGRYVLRSNLYG